MNELRKGVAAHREPKNSRIKAANNCDTGSSGDIDRLDLAESIQPLGRGIAKVRASEVPWYPQLLTTVCNKLAWTGDSFRTYRCRIDYPLYGSQVAIAFDTIPPPDRA